MPGEYDTAQTLRDNRNHRYHRHPNHRHHYHHTHRQNKQIFQVLLFIFPSFGTYASPKSLDTENRSLGYHHVNIILTINCRCPSCRSASRRFDSHKIVFDAQPSTGDLSAALPDPTSFLRRILAIRNAADATMAFGNASERFPSKQNNNNNRNYGSSATARGLSDISRCSFNESKKLYSRHHFDAIGRQYGVCSRSRRWKTNEHSELGKFLRERCRCRR